MRIYDGSPRQDFGEVLRAIGAHLDALGLREILLLETAGGFLIQGLGVRGAEGAWADTIAQVAKQTLTLSDEDVARLMDEAVARRGSPPGPTQRRYEGDLRSIGQFLDERRPRDVFLLEQGGAYVVRLLQAEQSGLRHELVEFTREDLDVMYSRGPTRRRQKILGA